jgi:hypothetical protein
MRAVALTPPPPWRCPQAMYGEGEAAFVANVGALVEPVAGSAEAAAAALPPSLFAHSAQARTTERVHAGSASTLGVLGRAVDAVHAAGYVTGRYSVSGAADVLEASPHSAASPVAIVDRKAGVPAFDPSDAIDAQPSPAAAMLALTESTSASVFAEAWSASLRSTLQRTAWLGAKLDGVELEQPFAAAKSSLGGQLAQVARIIKARGRSARAAIAQRSL